MIILFRIRRWLFKYIYHLIIILSLPLISLFSYNHLLNNHYHPKLINYTTLNNLYINNNTLFDNLFHSNKITSKFPISERSFSSLNDDVFQYGCRDPLIESSKNKRLNAAFVVLARNTEIDGVILSMRSLERRFNQWFNYPWIFLNDEPFNDEFKSRVEEVSSGEINFGLINSLNWQFPNNLENSPFFNEVVENQGDRGIMYGNMKSYHNMCRFYSGFFFEHPLIKDLEFYWRVEPDVEFYCDLTYDPFLEMKKNNKKYGFTITIKELINTVPNLFKLTNKFIIENNIKLPDTWSLFSNNMKFFKGENEINYKDVKNLDDFFKNLIKNTKYNYAKNVINNSDNNNPIPSKLLSKLNKLIINHSNSLPKSINEKFNDESYNLCHFWSNFEIASNELFTSPQYKAYYKFLEDSNGFFTERWGDAPIHSLAAGMFLNLSEIHYFRDIGYKHSTIGHCPYNSPNQLPYIPSDKFKHQVLPQDEIYMSEIDPPVKNPLINSNLGASGCRCRCPSDHREVENSGGSCSSLWLKLNDNNFPNSNSLTNHQLNLDLIENWALNSLMDWINNNGNIDDWEISQSERDLLSKNVI